MPSESAQSVYMLRRRHSSRHLARLRGFLGPGWFTAADVAGCDADADGAGRGAVTGAVGVSTVVVAEAPPTVGVTRGVDTDPTEPDVAGAGAAATVVADAEDGTGADDFGEHAASPLAKPSHRKHTARIQKV